jgi:hypothetical protein
MLRYVLLLTALLLEFELQASTTDVVLPGGVIQKIDHSQQYREQCLEGYTATEKYVVRNSHIREARATNGHSLLLRRAEERLIK